VLLDLVGTVRAILDDTFVGAYLQGWLSNDHGHRTLVPGTHCNSTHTRWILRQHGVTMAGPPIASLVDEVPAAAMRAAARESLPGTPEEILTWAPPIAWTQRSIVTTCCRVYYTQVTAKVASKRGALEWALGALDARWQPLPRQVIADRALGWRPDQPPRPGSLDGTRAFAAYVEQLSRREGSAG
jgi:hypothetical protein